MNEEEKINLSSSFKMPGLPDVEKIKKNVEGFKKFLNKPLKYDQNHKTGGESYSDVAQRMKTGQEPPAQQQTSTYTGLGGGIGKFLDQAAKTGKEAADNVMTGKHINVMPEDGKKKIKEGADYFNPAEKLRMSKDMTGGAYAAPGPIMKYHPVTLPKDIAKTQPPVEVKPTDPERLKKPIVPVKEANIIPSYQTPPSREKEKWTSTSGSGTSETGQSGSTGPSYSDTTPKQKPTPTTPSYEDGGKKGKKMSEENNKLIDMFLRLQEKNTLTPNIFEAAKKAKKDYDGDGKVESPKDEVWGSRFRAAKAAGKMEEEQIDELKKPTPETALKVVNRATDRDEWSPKAANRLYSSYKKRYEPKEKNTNVKEGAGDETAKKETSMSVTMDNKPSTPAQTTAATSGPSAADKKALDTKIKSIAKEEVEEIEERNLLNKMKDTMRLGSSGKERVDRISGALSDRGGNWDYKKGDFTEKGKSQVKSRLKNVKGASDYALNKEEVEFSQAEIDHINSFFEAVAPSRAEPTKGVNPTVRNTDLTDETLEELTGKGKLPGILRSIEDKQAKLKRIADRAEYLHAASNKNDSHKGPDSEKKFYMRQAKELRKEEVELEEGRPRKNPTPESTERDARQHIQVQAGRAAGGTVVDFKHDNGKVSKLTPGMGRAITAHLNGLKPAERQEAVKRMHASPEGLKV
jgi:hypothetical protein